MTASFVERLAWDSDFFGCEIGRLRPKPGDRPSPDLATAPFECVYVELAISDLPLVAEWVRVGACPVDIRVRLSQVVAGDRMGPGQAERMSLWTPADRRGAIRLAESLAPYSRFAADPRLAPRVVEMYRRWVALALDGQHGALVHRDAGRIDGLLTYHDADASAWIELLVVDADARGTGVGRGLIDAFLTDAAGRGIRRAEVRTQLRNVAALHAYTASGFAVEEVTLVLHWWRN